MKEKIDMNPEFDIVDLGTKHGWAIDEFRRKGNMYLKLPELFKQIKPQQCVGYERPQMEKYRTIVEKKNYKFRTADLAVDEAIAALPLAKIYLAFHFLEHVPNKDWSRKLVHQSLTNAQHLAWFKLPSFQQDNETGEGVLRQHGMRFTWTTWPNHPSHWLVEDCTDAIKEWSKNFPDRSYNLIVKPYGWINDMANDLVVPIDAPNDVVKYEPKHGPKPLHIKFKQPVISEYEVIVMFNKKGA